MTLAIVIPTFNRAQSLEKNLRALSNQTDTRFDVLIVDGGSTDATYRVIKKYQKKLHIRVLTDTTPHLSHIRNRAWKESQGDIIASIDDDVVVSPGWVTAIRHTLSDETIAGVTGPTVIPADLLHKRDVFLFHTSKNPFITLIGWFYFSLFMEGKRYEIGKVYSSGAWSPGSNFPSSLKLPRPITVDYLEACNFAIRRSVLEKTGGFDTGYTGTSEGCEVDLSFRIRKLGFKLVFNPHMATEHHVSQSGVYDRRADAVERIRNFVRFYIRSYYPKTIISYANFLLYLLFLFCYYGVKMRKGAWSR